MGSDQSREDAELDQNGPQILDSYNVIKKYQDPKYGESTLLEEKTTKEECILREINSTDEEEYAKGLKKYRARQKLTHPNIIQLKGSGPHIPLPPPLPLDTHEIVQLYQLKVKQQLILLLQILHSTET